MTIRQAISQISPAIMSGHRMAVISHSVSPPSVSSAVLHPTSRPTSMLSNRSPTIQEWLKFDGPAFLEVMVDKNAFVYPMVGPGMAYRDMLTGPHIEARDAAPSEIKLDTADAF